MNLEISEALEVLDNVLAEHGILMGDWTITEGPTPITPAEIKGCIGPDGRLEKDGLPFFVYIYNQTYQTWRGNPNNVEDRRKVHFTACPTITGKKKIEKYDVQYVLIRRGDGKFPAKFIIDNHERDEDFYEMLPCQHCLNKLNLKMEDFSFAKYLESDPKSQSLPPPIYTPTTIPQVGNYTSDWPKIARAAKKEEDYTCEKCGICHKGHRDKYKLIQAHHINGQRGDNRPSNLRVLCCCCHRQEPEHGHMRCPLGSDSDCRWQQPKH